MSSPQDLEWPDIIAGRFAFDEPDSFKIAAMNVLFQLLSEEELPALLEMMREFYAQQHMRFDENVARGAITQLLKSPAHGQIYLIFRGTMLAGYFALTFCFSLEFHGRFALLDELFLLEPFRRQKLGEGVAGFAESICRREGIAALRLEVGRDNLPAQSLYKKSGFQEDARNLMTKWF
jgi:ribosomal protein S18 acetylase RimI-like enzyme